MVDLYPPVASIIANNTHHQPADRAAYVAIIYHQQPAAAMADR